MLDSELVENKRYYSLGRRKGKGKKGEEGDLSRQVQSAFVRSCNMGITQVNGALVDDLIGFGSVGQPGSEHFIISMTTSGWSFRSNHWRIVPVESSMFVSTFVRLQSQSKTKC